MNRNRSPWQTTFCSVLFLVLILSANPIVFSQLVCQLSGAPIVQAGSLTAGDPTQAGRINRNGITGSCPTGKTNALFNASAVVQDNYTFNAPVTGCAEVRFDATQCGGATTQMVAYSTYNPATPGSNVIGDFGFSTTGTASFSFPVTSGQDYTLVVHDILEATNVFCTSYTFTVNYRTGCRQPGYDRTDDGMADPTFFNPSAGTWNTFNSAGGTETKSFGLAGDIPTAGDYTGDGQTDVSTYRPSASTWFYSTSQTEPQNNVTYVPWGVAGDIPVPGDYDGDGTADVAVWRPSDGVWYVLRSSDATVMFFRWGRNGDIPVSGDFDGDHRTDFVIARPDKVGVTPKYNWYLSLSNFNFGFNLRVDWGLNTDLIAPGDYDGNGKTDIAVFRPTDGTWYVIPSLAQNAVAAPASRFGFRWGLAGDVPQPADYDADMRTDYAVFRPGTGDWFISNSDNGTYSGFDVINWGTATDTPATAPYPIRP